MRKSLLKIFFLSLGLTFLVILLTKILIISNSLDQSYDFNILMNLSFFLILSIFSFYLFFRIEHKQKNDSYLEEKNIISLKKSILVRSISSLLLLVIFLRFYSFEVIFNVLYIIPISIRLFLSGGDSFFGNPLADNPGAIMLIVVPLILFLGVGYWWLFRKPLSKNIQELSKENIIIFILLLILLISLGLNVQIEKVWPYSPLN